LLLLHGINLERPERTLYVRGGISENVPNPMQETGRFLLYVDVLFPKINIFSILGSRMWVEVALASLLTLLRLTA
jgi:hypothetical protein